MLSKTYYSLLDGVRFFAAFWVMNFHYLGGLELSATVSWYRYGNLGVQLFFIISGFVIIQSLHGKTLKQFMQGRLIRLFPLFWILCTVTYILTLVIPHAAHVIFPEYLVNMTMLTDLFNGKVGGGALVDASYWTLTVELIFYTGVGVFTSLFSYDKIRYFLMAWLACTMVAFALHIDQNYFVKLLLVRHASYFIFGSSLALISTQQAKHLYEKYIDHALLFGSAIYATYIHTRAIPAYVTPNMADNHIITVLHIVFFVSIPLLVYLSQYVTHPRIITLLTILGGLTYPLYLLHQRIGNVLINALSSMCHVSWNTLAISFEVVIICAAYVVYVQDKKLRRWVTSLCTQTKLPRS